MSKDSRNPGLFQRLLARPAPLFQDAADLGTAFGMEVCLGQADESPVPPSPAPRRAPAWMQRLTARSRAAP